MLLLRWDFRYGGCSGVGAGFRRVAGCCAIFALLLVRIACE